MSKDRGFFWSSRAWYHREAITTQEEEITFGIYPDGGNQGTIGEMRVVWEEWGEAQVPQLRVYDDAWAILSGFSDLLDYMAGSNAINITPEEFVEILKECGFKDLTPYEKPMAGTTGIDAYESLIREKGPKEAARLMADMCREKDVVLKKGGLNGKMAR